ncbi:unnamed protein product [Dovyalis caffra]|uniref:Apple domain-containing protein n=1 Tax=Dovyalis caffra TaxID=77055 RepID=A0AAV1RY90_9ROSI|nr:unnamed protein product [Dovyalis caffra]
MTLPANSKASHESSDAGCRLDCIRNCSCMAYAYNNSGCFLWEGALINLQQAGIAGGGRTGADIYIRLSASELQHQIGSGSPLIVVGYDLANNIICSIYKQASSYTSAVCAREQRYILVLAVISVTSLSTGWLNSKILSYW